MRNFPRDFIGGESALPGLKNFVCSDGDSCGLLKKNETMEFFRDPGFTLIKLVVGEEGQGKSESLLAGWIFAVLLFCVYESNSVQSKTHKKLNCYLHIVGSEPLIPFVAKFKM